MTKEKNSFSNIYVFFIAAGMNKDGVYNKKEITSLKKRLEAKISETIQEEEFVNDDDDDESNQESDVGYIYM